jgi:hypothetical protein
VHGKGWLVKGTWFRVWGLGFRVNGLGLIGCEVQDLGCRA